MANQILTQEYVKTLFDYKNGHLYWKISRSPRVKIGQEAGCKSDYRLVRLGNKTYGTHVLVWTMYYGFPSTGVDHKNRNPLDNRIENLRLANKSQNGLNRPKQANNTSGYKNVSWFKPKQKWRVRLNLMGKEIHIGYFDNLELADLVAQEARDKYHCDYASN